MIRAIDNKRLDLNNEEYGYYLKLVESFGAEEFSGLFETNKNGQIISITPPVEKKISLGVMFFILNVMMNQQLRALSDVVEKNKKNVADSCAVDNIEKRLAQLEAKVFKGEQ